MPPLVFKPLGPDNVLINPFKVHKTQTVEYTSGSSDIKELSLVEAIDFLDLTSFDPETSDVNANGTFKGPLFKSIEHIFYTSGAMSSSSNFAAGGSGIRDFPLTSSAFVVNISQAIFGEGIRPGSFILKSANSEQLATASIIDDGQGRLLVSGSGRIVGNVFYDIGIAVINRHFISKATISTGKSVSSIDSVLGVLRSTISTGKSVSSMKSSLIPGMVVSGKSISSTTSSGSIL